MKVKVSEDELYPIYDMEGSFGKEVEEFSALTDRGGFGSTGK